MAEPIDFERSIRRVICTVLQQEEGFIRPADQNKPTGDVSALFGTVKLLSIDPIGPDGSTYKNNEDDDTKVTETIEGIRHLQVSIQFYRAGAKAMAARLKALMQSSIAAQLMADLGLGYIRSGPVTNIAAVTDTKWEERCQLNMEFYVGAEESVDLDIYETIRIQGTVGTLTSNVDEVKLP